MGFVTMKFIILLILSVAPFISSQGFRFQGSHDGGNGNRRLHSSNINRRIQSDNPSPKLGLLAHQLGVNPVPGGNNFGGNPNSAGGSFNNFNANPNSAGGNFNSFGGNPNSAAALGGFGNTHNGPRGCFCLPKNQVCDPFEEIPLGSTRISTINTRIVNLDPENPCPPEEKECCFGPIGPPDEGPSPIGGCGTRSRKFSAGSRSDGSAEFAEYPWMTAIVNGTADFVSGGVILTPNAVLTTAHSVQHPSRYRVRAGDYNLGVSNENPNFPHQENSVRNIIFHPEFNSATLANDVAILLLSHPLQFGHHINSVCLPEPRQVFSGSRCYLSGWGKNVQGQQSGILREVDLPILTDESCENSLRETRLGKNFKLDYKSFLCAGGESGKDACSDDGGSPLVCQEHQGFWTVVGLVAWGIGCGTPNVPGVYLDVASYSNFINQYI